MPISDDDIEFALSGGAANTSPAASLGGPIATTGTKDIPETKNALLDDVAPDEATVGDVEYRGLYVRNGHATDPLLNAVIWIDQSALPAGTTVEIGLAVEDVGVAMATIADESTAPSGVTFSAPAARESGLSLNTAAPLSGLSAGAYRGVWIKRTIPAGAGQHDDVCALVVGGTPT